MASKGITELYKDKNIEYDSLSSPEIYNTGVPYTEI